MPARVLDGKALAATIRGEVRKEVEQFDARGIELRLDFVLVGDDPASLVYVGGKNKACEEVGIESRTHRLPATTSQDEVLALIESLNGDDAVHGILVQLPLPPKVSEEVVLDLLDPEKDVDGFTHENLGRLLAGRPRFVPATPSGVLAILQRNGLGPERKHVAIVGRGNIVGKPLSALLTRKGDGGDATVTLCHSATPDLAAVTSRADIVVAATGKAGLIRSGHVRPGATVIDVGINRVVDLSAPKGTRLVGDVAYDEVARVAGAITPVPGGVGPMTIAMLLRNVVQSGRHFTR